MAASGKGLEVGFSSMNWRNTWPLSRLVRSRLQPCCSILRRHPPRRSSGWSRTSREPPGPLGPLAGRRLQLRGRFHFKPASEVRLWLRPMALPSPLHKGRLSNMAGPSRGLQRLCFCRRQATRRRAATSYKRSLCKLPSLASRCAPLGPCTSAAARPRWTRPPAHFNGTHPAELLQLACLHSLAAAAPPR
jgi:hypothetical protein